MSAEVLFAVDKAILVLAAGIGRQRYASALPEQPLPKGVCGISTTPFAWSNWDGSFG
jgi:hypothetical protein